MENISVIGAGTMGKGIAQVFALNQYKVKLIDKSDNILSSAKEEITKNIQKEHEKSPHKNINQQNIDITFTSDLEEYIKDADLVVEAVNEQEDLKCKIFKILDQNTSKNCILASNTSSISITKLASYTFYPERVAGMHFMNPVPVMSLIEVISGFHTSTNTIKQINEIIQSIGKVPVEAKDYPGFISNRILMSMINEAIFTLYDNTGTVEGIDTVMKLGMNHPMGALKLADFIGLDVCQSVLNILYKGFGNTKYAPCPLLDNMVIAGELGKKTGRGFYDWQKDKKKPEVSPRFL